MKKTFIILCCIGLFGCQYREKEDEISFKNENGTIIVLTKICIDGVVYLSGNGYLTPKFNQDSKVEICEKEAIKK